MAAQQQQQGKLLSLSRALWRMYRFYCRGALNTTVNLNTIGCLWTGEFDLNTLRMKGEFLNQERKFKNIWIRVERASVMKFCCFPF